MKTKPALGAFVILALVYGTLALVQGGGEGVGSGESAANHAVRALPGSPSTTPDYPSFAEYQAQLAEADRVAAEAQQAAEEAARVPVPPNVSSPRVANPGPSQEVQGYPPECYGRAIPPAQLYRESKCSTDPGLMSPPTFCSGRGCVGPYQIDSGHFAADSPWNDNPAVSGVCYGLDPATTAGQEACAGRLGPGAWG